MAYNEALADRIRQRIQAPYRVVERKMMGALVFMVNDKMCVGVDIDIDKATRMDRLMIRVGKLPYAELLGHRGSRPMDFTGKVLRGFVYVDPDFFEAEADLDYWVGKALELNAQL